MPVTEAAGLLNCQVDIKPDMPRPGVFSSNLPAKHRHGLDTHSLSGQ